MPTTLNIRYTTEQKRIKNLIPLHYKQLKSALLQQGGNVNTAELLKYMGITAWRFNIITQNDSAEPTIGEVVRYAEYFNMPIQQLYKVVPVKAARKSK